MAASLVIKIKTVVLLLVIIMQIVVACGVEGTVIGIDYGKLATKLPSPNQVASFIVSSTIFNHVRLFDSDSQTLEAFAHTDISVTVTVPNSEIPSLSSSPDAANKWVSTAVAPAIAGGTDIVRILVGNEVLSTANAELILSLLPAMESLHSALMAQSLDGRIQISTPFSLGLLSNDERGSPPSAARFRAGYDTHVIRPILAFLRAIGSPFVVNPYPFFGATDETLDFALFRDRDRDEGMVFDEMSQKKYTNMFDAQMDSVFSAMKAVGFEDVEIVVGETGWPSDGDRGQVGADPRSAEEYNRGLIKHVLSGSGTPLMPNRSFEVYLFALFDEDLKPGPTCERHFGLFKTDFSPVYDAGVVLQRPAIISPAPSTAAADRTSVAAVSVALGAWAVGFVLS